MRVDGELIAITESSFDPAQLEEMLFEILSEEERVKFLASRNLDKSYHGDSGHFRVNMFFTSRGVAAVLRAIPKKIPSFEELGLPSVISRLTDLPKGLVLVTGPTGSGKSTTLAAMIHHINCNHPYHILTAEDPIEFVHQSRRSLINQREIGTHCPTFSDALKYALREDPDVILVGEMRDLETIALALTAAETGHLVFGTLHTRGAAASVDRIIDSFPANQQAMIRTMLSESLAAVVSQCLLRRAEGKGRMAAYEILVVNTAIANLIREGKTYQMPSIIQTARKEGMVLMEQSILELVQKKVVAPQEAAAFLDDSAVLGPWLKNSGAVSAKVELPQKPKGTLSGAPKSKPPIPSVSNTAKNISAVAAVPAKATTSIVPEAKTEIPPKPAVVPPRAPVVALPSTVCTPAISDEPIEADGLESLTSDATALPEGALFQESLGVPAPESGLPEAADVSPEIPLEVLGDDDLKNLMGMDTTAGVALPAIEEEPVTAKSSSPAPSASSAMPKPVSGTPTAVSSPGRNPAARIPVAKPAVVSASSSPKPVVSPTPITKAASSPAPPKAVPFPPRPGATPPSVPKSAPPMPVKRTGSG
jgi:twitching motility protein PilT